MIGPPAEEAEKRGRPRFTKVQLYNDPSGLLSFWYAADWHLEVESKPLPCVRLTPDLSDPDTHMAIALSELGAPLLPEERAAVLEGVQEGLKQLEECEVQSLSEITVEGSWGVEWRCSFRCGEGRYVRRGRLFFRGPYQYAVVYQGSSQECFSYWRGMFGWTMLTITPGAFDARRWLEAQNASGRS